MIPNAGPENVGANTAGDNLPNALQKNTKDSIAFILYNKKQTIEQLVKKLFQETFDFFHESPQPQLLITELWHFKLQS